MIEETLKTRLEIPPHKQYLARVVVNPQPLGEYDMEDAKKEMIDEQKNLVVTEKPYCKIKAEIKRSLTGKAGSWESVTVEVHEPKNDPLDSAQIAKAEEQCVTVLRRVIKKFEEMHLE